MFGLFLLVHVLGATVWTGGHLILAVTILPRALQERSTNEIRRFEEAFEWIGIPALVGQLVTGLWLAYRLVPDPLEWLAFGSPVTRLIGFKLVLLTITVLLAADARLRVIPRLTAERLTSLAWHIVPVTVTAVLYVVVGLSFRTGWLP